MSYTIILPCGGLKDLISHFWAGRRNDSDDTNATYYATANTRTELVFAFKPLSNHHPGLLSSSIQGQTHHFGQYPAIGFNELFGVSLYPNAIPCFFKLSASELNNRFIGIDTLLGNEGKLLSEAIANATTTENRIKILTDYFKSRLTHPHSEDRHIIQAVKQIKKRKGIVNISDLAAEFYLSPKQFERRFKAYLGFNPKLYSRIVRFEAVLDSYGKYNTFTEAAYANGYYDQAHLIYDFKKFSGFSPTQFFALARY